MNTYFLVALATIATFAVIISIPPVVWLAYGRVEAREKAELAAFFERMEKAVGFVAKPCDREMIWAEGAPGHFWCEIHGHYARWHFDQDLPVCIENGAK